MLSPLEYYKDIPREERENLRWRTKMQEDCYRDPAYRQRVLDICAHDILFWINGFVYQINYLQGQEGRPGPFITWPCQERAFLKRPGVLWPGDDPEDAQALAEAGLVWCMEKGRTAMLEKSRDMGASWMCLLLFDWRFLFHRWMKFLCISRSEDAVDNPGDPDCLFWKLDFVHKRLPEWMVPAGGIKRRKRYFGIESTGSSITGQASTGLAGVGGRATGMFIDEFALIREDAEVRGFTANTARCRIFNSTHRGLDTEMYKMSREPDIVKIRLHWTQHPEKVRGLYRSQHVPEIIDTSCEFPPNYEFVRDGRPLGGPYPGLRSRWYDAKCKEIGAEFKIAMDLDINPERTVSQFFDGLMIYQLIREFAQKPWWEGDLIYDRDTGKPDKLMPGKGGRVKLWCTLDISGRPAPDRYGIGIDPSTGTGASNTCLSVASSTTGEKVCEVADPMMGAVECAEFAAALATFFADKHGDPACVGWQMQGPGAKLKSRLVDELGFRNVFRRPSDFTHLQPQESDRIGLDSANKQTRILLDDYATSLQKREFLNRSEVALKECLNWKWSDKGEPEWAGTMPDDPSGARENHGDRSVADFIANRVIRTLGVPATKPRRKEEPMVLSPAWRYEYHEKKLRTEEQEIEV